MSWLVVAAWIAPPLALALELVHAHRAVAKASDGDRSGCSARLTVRPP